MNKDLAFKNQSGYESRDLKGRVSELQKDIRYEADEVKNPRLKSLSVIPVTGGKPLKYLKNKSLKEY